MKKLFVFIVLLLLVIVSTKSVFASVYINEVFSFDNNGDWVELYATETTDISGWALKDSGSSPIETFASGTTINKESFLIVNASNRLNKDEDTLRLVKPDQSLANLFAYGPSSTICAPEAGQSVGRYPGDGADSIERFASPTKGSTNMTGSVALCPSSATPTPTPTPSPTFTPTLTPTKTTTLTPTEFEEVLGEDEEITPTIELTPTPIPSLSESKAENEASTSKRNFPVPAILLGLTGLVFIGVGIVLFMRKKGIMSR